MIAADLLHERNQQGSPLEQPLQSLGADFEMLGIARLHIGFIQRVEPGTFTVLVARKGFSKATILLFGQGAEELDIV